MGLEDRQVPRKESILKTSYVDVAVRVEVTHGADEDPTEKISEADYSFTGDGIGNAEMKDVQVAGTKDEQSGALVREDGQTGRNVEILHTPPVE